MTARLVVVENDPEIRRLIGVVLRQAGHEVVATVGCLDELDPETTGVVDLIFCPVGYVKPEDLARVAELKRLYPLAKVVGLTAGIHAIDPNVLAAAQTSAGLARILGKPFTIQELLDAVG